MNSASGLVALLQEEDARLQVRHCFFGLVCMDDAVCVCGRGTERRPSRVVSLAAVQRTVDRPIHYPFNGVRQCPSRNV